MFSSRLGEPERSASFGRAAASAVFSHCHASSAAPFLAFRAAGALHVAIVFIAVVFVSAVGTVAGCFLHVLDPAFRQSRRADHFSTTVAHFPESTVVVHRLTERSHFFGDTFKTPNQSLERNGCWRVLFNRERFWLFHIAVQPWLSLSFYSASGAFIFSNSSHAHFSHRPGLCGVSRICRSTYRRVRSVWVG
jgi:hypothetical protein